MIPHCDQRYNTVGDWEYNPDKEHLDISVSALRDWREGLAVAIHEIFEAALCIQDGIPQGMVDHYDQKCLQEGFEGEPGERPAAPYYNQHLAATVAERLFCWQIGVHWPEYEDHLDKLDTPSKPGVEHT
jgi:hypothetical protein